MAAFLLLVLVVAAIASGHRMHVNNEREFEQMEFPSSKALWLLMLSTWHPSAHSYAVTRHLGIGTAANSLRTELTAAKLDGPAKAFAKKYGKRGLRRKDDRRDIAELQKLYYSVPGDIRKDPEVLTAFMRKVHFGHIHPHSKGGDNTVNNGVWQDAYSNRRLSNNEMPDCLKQLIRQQGRYFAKYRHFSSLLRQQQDACLDALYAEKKAKSLN